MAAKPEGDGPARSLVFQRIIECLGVTVMLHLPAGTGSAVRGSQA
jgi:hypothetical protein